MEAALKTELAILVVLEMCMSLLGIVCNLLIVATVRQDETLRATTLNFLLFNLCSSNLLIAFFVKPISAIYTGYAISTDQWQVGLAFCTLYTFTYRTTWCVFPFTLIAMCWCKLLAQCRCGKCGILCCARDKKSPKGSKPGTNTDTLPLTIRYDNADQKEVHSIQGKGDIIKGSPRGTAISLPHCDTTTELTVLQHRKAGLDFSPQRLSQCSGSIDRPTPPLLKSELSKHSGENGSLVREDAATPSLTFSAVEDAKEPLQQKVIRTLEDGPTSRQKLLVISIWIFSALFGASTCFPDKVFGGVVAANLIAGEDSLRGNRRFNVFENATNDTRPNRDVDLSYCSVKTGVNDLLDYMAISVSLIIPFVIGPLVVGVFQGLFAMFGLFVCRPEHVDERGRSSGPHRRENAPGWPIIIGFTIVFLSTYPLHMYVSEVYLADSGSSFAFVMAKYCIGFLYVIFVPIVTLCLQKEIRIGLATVFGSAVMCVQLQEIRRSNTQEANAESREGQTQLQPS